MPESENICPHCKTRIAALNENQSAQIEKSHIVFVDVLRIISAFAVVMIHVTSNFYYLRGNAFLPFGYSSAVCMFFNVLSRFAVPVFFMISGMLLLSERTDCSLKTVYTKRIPRILLPLIVWALFYAFFAYRGHIIRGNFGLSHASGFISYFMNGYYHLWFLYALIGIYAVSPILKLIVKDRQVTYYLCGIIAFFTCICGTVSEIFKKNAVKNFLLGTEDSGWYIIGKIVYAGANRLSYFLGKFHMDIFSVYILSFILGYILATMKFSKKQRIILYSTGIACLIFMIAGTVFNVLHNIQYDFWISSSRIFALVFAVAIFVFVKEVFGSRELSPSIQKVISMFAKYSFGIYLLHAFVLDMLCRFLPIKWISYPIITFMGYSGVIFILSFAACRLIAKIPCLQKLVM